MIRNKGINQLLVILRISMTKLSYSLAEFLLELLGLYTGAIGEYYSFITS